MSARKVRTIAIISTLTTLVLGSSFVAKAMQTNEESSTTTTILTAVPTPITTEIPTEAPAAEVHPLAPADPTLLESIVGYIHYQDGNNEGVASLGTVVQVEKGGNVVLLSHNHHFELPLASGSSTEHLLFHSVRGVQKDITLTNVEVSSQHETTRLTFPTHDLTLWFGKRLTPAQSVDAATLESIQVGEGLAVTFWDETTQEFGITTLRIVDIDWEGGAFKLADPDKIINKGDSGGGVFYNGLLVGNNWAIQHHTDNIPGQTVVVAINPLG